MIPVKIMNIGTIALLKWLNSIFLHSLSIYRWWLKPIRK
jgi:hypothetical protein